MSQPSGGDAAESLRRALLALQKMRAKLERVQNAQREPIAIVGLACRFPGGSVDKESYWRMLIEGRDGVREVPADRWPVEELYDPDPAAAGKTYVRAAGFIDEVDRFDARFFGVAPREAMAIDPQQRLLLEVAWEALENAGHASERLRKSRTGVFVGLMSNDYGRLVVREGENIDEEVDIYAGTGNDASFLAGRLSYLLGLQGPSMTISTSCSSSLVSTHLAVQSLRAGECRMALAGGVNVMLTPDMFVLLSKMKALAADGRSKAFDARADGFGRGEGCGVVVLKRLSDAIADGDHIVALVRGVAVNHDGPSNGLTVPNGEAQEAVLRAALTASGVEPHEVGYVEAHGTGTSLGDPIELRALHAVLGQGRDRPIRLGAVKANIGHLEAAAGVASLIKSALILERGRIPPQVHLEERNPYIPWDDLPFKVSRQATAWETNGAPRIAGVSAFGMSGTNAHALLEEAPKPAPRRSGPERPLHVLALSGHSASALDEMAARYIEFLGDSSGHSSGPSSGHGVAEDPLGDIAFTANAGRSHFEHRLALVAKSPSAARQQLIHWRDGQSTPGLWQGGEDLAKPRIAFLFSGQGAQYPGMGRELYETQPVFRAAIDECAAILERELEQPLTTVLFAEGDALHQTRNTQPALVALEVALVRLWRSWGVEPTAVMGHSVGEYAAACVAGVYSLEDGLRMIAERGRLMQALPGHGSMAAVRAGREQIEPLIQGDPRLSIAAINGPRNLVLSGDAQALAACVARLGELGIQAKELRVSHGFHSAQMDPMLEPWETFCDGLSASPAQIGWVSNLTGQMFSGTESPDGAYWRRHVRQPVDFAAGLATLRQQGCNVFVEIGPGTTLVGMGRQCLGTDRDVTWLPSLRPAKGDWQQILESLAKLYTQAADIDWQGFDRPHDRRRRPLPTYAFERQRYWFLPESSGARAPVRRERDDLFYDIEWRVRPLLESSEAEGPSADARDGDWLIVANSGGGEAAGTAAALAERLSADGGRAVVASADEAFETHLDAQVWCGVVHVGSLDARPSAETTAETLAQDQETGCQSVLRLAQNLSRHAEGTQTPPRLWMVTRGAQAVLPGEGVASVAQSPVWGLGRVVALEMPSLRSAVVDLDPQEFDPQRSDRPRFGSLDGLAREIRAGGDGESLVAWRGGNRLVARLRRTPAPTASEWRPPADRHCLITGGFGALGLSLARWLVSRGARHLSLAGRRGMPDDGAEAVEAIRQMGAEVQTVALDVGDADAVAAFFEEYGDALGGIVHAAGVVDPAPLADLTPAQMDATLHPKVIGTWQLYEQSRDLDLDFFVSFSSIASVWGSAGLGPYAAANQFLDALAHRARAEGRPMTSLNWGRFAQRGMVSDENEIQLEKMGLKALALDRAWDGLGDLLAQGVVQQTVAAVDWRRLLQVFEARGRVYPLLEDIAPEARRRRRDAPEAGALRALEGQPRDRVLQGLIAYLKEQIAPVLGFESGALRLDDTFFALGMDSLTAVEIKDRIEVAIGETLPGTLLFEYPSIRLLAEQLQETVLAGEAVETDGGEPALAASAASAGEDPFDLLEQLESLPEDEVEALYATRILQEEVADG